MKPRILSIARLSFSLATAIAALLSVQYVQAATIYWDGTSATWNTAANWSTASGAITPNPAAVPGAADDAIFNITTVNGAETITLGTNQAIGSMTFNNTGTTTLTGGGTARTLTLGTGGITMAATAGAVTLGNGAATDNVLISLATGAQTWTNNSAANFTINNTAASFTRAAGATLFFNQASTGIFSMSTTVLPNVSSIVGPWAFFGTGANMKYAVNNAGTIAGLTGTAATQAGWTSATANYEYSTAETLAAARTGNTFRYTGGALTTSLGASGAFNLTANGILAVGASGTLTITRTGTSTGTVIIGATNELVVAGQQAVTISAPISGASGALTYSGSNTLTLSGINTYGSATRINSGTLTVGSAGQLGSGTYAQAINIASGATFKYSSSAAQTLSGAISGAGAIIKDTSTASTLTLSGANASFTGSITLTSGTLALDSTGALGGATAISLAAGTTLDAGVSGISSSAPITLTGGGTRTIQQSLGTSSSLTLGAIGGSGNLVLQNISGGNPTQTFTLNGASTYSGTTLLDSTVINASVRLNLGVDNALPTTTVLTIDGNAGDGSGRTITLNTNGKNQTLAGLTSVISGTLRDNRVLNSSGTLSTLTIDGSTNTTYAGMIGSGGANIRLVKSGTGTFTLSGVTTLGSNSYTGGTILNQGTLTVTNNGTTTSGTLGATTGTLTVNNNNTTAAGTNVNLNLATGVDTTVGTLSGTISAPTSGTNTATINNGGVGRNFTVNQTAAGTYAGTIAGAGAFTLGSLSTNALTLTGRSTFTGNVTVSAGTLVAGINASGVNTALGNASTVGRTISVANGATLRFDSGNVLSTNFSSNTVPAITVTGGTLTNGSTATNNALGNLTLAGGTLSAASGTGSGSGYGNWNLNGTVTSTGTSTISNASSVPITLSAATGTNTTFDVTSGTLTASAALGQVTATGDEKISSLTKSGAGSMILSGNNTFTGGVIINAGTLTLANAGALNSTVGSENAVTFGASSTGTLVLGGNSVVIRSLNSNATPGTPVVENTNAGNATLTIGNSLNLASSFAGVIRNGTGAGTLGLTKAGTNTLTLSGDNSYTGATLISAGTLTLSSAGDINSTSGITVNGSGAKFLHTGSVAVSPTVTLTQGTLTGSGTVDTVNVGAGTGGIISNNDGVAGAALTIGALTFNGGATVNTFSSSTSAPISTTYLVGSGGANDVTINPTAATWTNGATYNLIGYSSITNPGSFTRGTVTGLAIRQSASLLYDTGSALAIDITGDKPVWSGLGSQTWTTAPDNDNTGPNAWALKTANTATNFWATDNVEFNDTYNLGSGDVTVTNATVTITGGVAPTATLFNNSTLVNYTLTTSDSTGIATGILTKNGTGSLTINNANTYTGGTNLNAGTLEIGNASALGTSGTITLGGGTLKYGTGITTDLSSRFSTAASQAYKIDTNGNNVTFASILSSTSGVLTKSGAGTLILTGNNTYSGGTTINANSGTLQATKNAAVTNALGGGAVDVGTGSTLVLDITKTTLITDTVANTFTGAGLLKLQFAAGTTARNTSLTNVTGFGGTIQLSSLGTTGDKWNALNVGTVAGSLVVDTGNTIFVNGGPASFTGGITINGAGNSDLRGAIRVSGATTVVGGNISLASSSTISMETVAAQITGDISSGAAGTQTLTLGAASSTGGTLSGIIGGGTGTINLATATGGTYTLTNTNTYTGTTSIAASTTLQLGNGTTGNDGTINSTSGVTNNGTLAFNRFGSDSASYSIGGTGAVTKLGAGTQTLSGLSATAANNYSGTTTIGGGTLALTHATTADLTGGLTFGASVGSTTVGTLDLSAASASFAGALLVQTNTASSNTITIGSGKTLTIGGNVTIGANVANAVASLVTSGGGDMVVGTGGTNTFIVGGVTGSALAGSTAVDLSGLASLTVNYGLSGTFRLGDSTSGSNNPAPSTLKLATDNTITVGNFRIGDSSGGQAIHVLTLGTGANTINATTVNIGSAGSGIRSGGSMIFDPADTTGTLTLRGFDGGSTSTILNMVNSTGNTAAGMTSIVDLSGHTADIMASTMTMASRSGTGTGSSGTATFTFDQGTLDVTTLVMSRRAGGAAIAGNTTATMNLGDSAALGVPTVTIGNITMAAATAGAAGSTATADLNITGGNVTIGSGSGTAINLANAAAGLVATSSLDITGGTVTVTGDIIRTVGAGTETATLALNGASAILDMSGKNITSLTGITYTDGTLKNLGTVNTGMTLAGTGSRVFDQGTGVNGEIQGAITGMGVGLTKQGLGKLTLSGTNSYDGDTTISAGTLQLGAGGITGSLAAGAIVNNSNLTINRSNTVTQGTDFSGADITGTGSFTQAGTGNTILNVANSYTGGTTVSAGTLELTNSSAAGVGGAIALTGATSVLKSASAITVANNITLSDAGAKVDRVLAATEAFTTGTNGNLTSSFTGGTPHTTAQILDGDSTGGGIFSMSFSANPTPAVANDGIRRSDVFTTTGTGTDQFVVQLFVTGGLAADSRLGWLNGSNLWVSAGTNFFADTPWTNTFTAGDYGFDNVTNSVWGVVQYGNVSSFAAIPEPTSALVGLLIGAGLLRRRRSA